MITFFLRVLRKLNLLRFFNFYLPADVGGKKFVAPVMAGIGMGNLNISEPWMSYVLKKLMLARGTTFLDVGVNIGQTMIKLKTLYPDLDYIGFEPNPECIYYATHLAKVNKWENIQLIPAGIAEKTSLVELNFYSDDVTDSCASIVADFRAEMTVTRKSFCPCFHPSALEAVFTDKNISVVKIDVEGAEMEVIMGLRDIFLQHTPYLLVEILPAYQADSTRLSRQEAIEQLLVEYGYSMYRIHKDQADGFSHLEEIKSIGIHDRLDWCEYLCSPTSLVGWEVS